MTPITAETVEFHDGLVIPYLEQGDPDGVPLVLLHGITDSHRSYEPVIAELPHSVRAIAITAAATAMPGSRPPATTARGWRPT